MKGRPLRRPTGGELAILHSLWKTRRQGATVAAVLVLAGLLVGSVRAGKPAVLRIEINARQPADAPVILKAKLTNTSGKGITDRFESPLPFRAFLTGPDAQTRHVCVTNGARFEGSFGLDPTLKPGQTVETPLRLTTYTGADWRRYLPSEHVYLPPGKYRLRLDRLLPGPNPTGRLMATGTVQFTVVRDAALAKARFTELRAPAKGLERFAEHVLKATLTPQIRRQWYRDIRDPDPEKAVWKLYTLCNFVDPPPDVMPAIVAALKVHVNNPNVTDRHLHHLLNSAARAMLNRHPPGAGPALLKLATGKFHPSDREMAIEALRHYYRREMADRIAALLKDESTSISWYAARLLAWAGDDRGADMLIAYAKAKNPSSAAALAYLPKHKAAAEAFQEALSSEDREFANKVKKAVATQAGDDGKKPPATQPVEVALRIGKSVIMERKRPYQSVDDMAFAPDGKTIVAANNNSLRMWDTASGKSLTPPRRDKSEGCFSVRFLDDGRKLATSGYNDIRIDRWPAGTPVKRFPGGGGSLLSVSADGKLLLAAQSSVVKLWRTDGFKLVRSIAHPDGGGRRLNTVALSPDGGVIAAGKRGLPGWQMAKGARRADFFLLRARTGAVVHRLTGFASAMSFSADGRRLAVIHYDDAKVWDVTTGKPAWPVKTGDRPPRCLAWSPRDGILAVGTGDGSVHLLSAATGRLLWQGRVGHGRVTAVAFSRDGARLAAGDRGGLVRIWNLSVSPGRPKAGADGNDLPPAEGLRDVGDFLAALTPRIAEGWELDQVDHGRVFPPAWPPGRGFHIVIHDTKAPVAAGKRAPWTDVHLWVMGRDYKAKGPLRRDDRPTDEITRWRGRRVFLYGGKERWPRRRDEVLAALKAADTDKPRGRAAAIQQRFKAFAAFVEKLGPKVHSKWHCRDFRYSRQQMGGPGVPQGSGLYLFLRHRRQKDKKIGPDDPYGEVMLWLMDPSFKGQLPKKTAKNFVPDEVGRWHGGRSFVWGYARGAGNWHTWQRDLRVAMRASDAAKRSPATRSAAKPLDLDKAAKLLEAAVGGKWDKTVLAIGPEKVTVLEGRVSARPGDRCYDQWFRIYPFGFDGTGRKRMLQAPRAHSMPNDIIAIGEKCTVIVRVGARETSRAVAKALKLKSVDIPEASLYAADAIEEGFDRFALRVRYHGPQGKSLFDLTVTSGEGKAPARSPRHLHARVDKTQGLKLIHSLLLAGHLDRMKGKDLRYPRGPAYTLEVAHPGNEDLKYKYYTNLGWGPLTFERLQDLRATLGTGDAATAMDRLLKSLEPQGRPWAAPGRRQPLLLPAHGYGLPQAVRDGFRFIAVCQAVSEPTLLNEEPPQNHAFQRFKVLKVLAGKQQPGQTVLLRYTYVEIPSQREGPIAKGGRVIWIVAPGYKCLRGIKALADTPRNRAALVPLAATAKLAAERAGKLGAVLDKFRLSIWYCDERAAAHHNLTLHVAAEAPAPVCPFHGSGGKTKDQVRLVRITTHQAGRVIDRLWGDGFLADSRNIHGLRLEPVGSPAMVLKVHGPDKTTLFENLYWGLPMLKRLAVLRVALDGQGGAKEMAGLLKRLAEQHPEWEKPPGKILSVRRVVRCGYTFIAICEALNEPQVVSAATSAYQKFKMHAFLDGTRPAGKTFNLNYHYYANASPPDRPVRKGEKVIWIVRERADPYRGVRVLAYTPENHRAVVEAVQVERYAGKAVNGLKLTLRAAKAATAMCPDGRSAEPVPLTFTFANVGDKPIKIETSDHMWPRLKLHVTGPNGKSVRITERMAERIGPIKVTYSVLKAGQSVTHSRRSGEYFGGKHESHDLLKPGAYRIWASYLSAVAVSNEITLTVKATPAAPDLGKAPERSTAGRPADPADAMAAPRTKSAAKRREGDPGPTGRIAPFQQPRGLTAEQRKIADEVVAGAMAEVQADTGIFKQADLLRSIAELAKRQKKRRGWVPAEAVGRRAQRCRWWLVPAPKVITEKVVDDIVFQYRNAVGTSDQERRDHRRRCALALGRIGHPKAVGVIIDCLQTDGGDLAWWALEGISDKRILPVITEVLNAGGHVGSTAALYLGRLGKAGVPALRHLLAEGKPHERSGAIQALVRIGLPECLPPLEELQRSGKVLNRETKRKLSAAIALLRCRAIDRTYIPPDLPYEDRCRLHHLATLAVPSHLSSGRISADQAVTALIRLGWRIAAVALRPQLSSYEHGDGSPGAVFCTSERAADIMVRIGEPAIPALLDALNDEHPHTRAHAAKALRRITGQKLGTDYAAWRKWCLKAGKLKPVPPTTQPPADAGARAKEAKDQVAGLLADMKAKKIPDVASLTARCRRVEEALLKLLADEDRRARREALVLVRGTLTSPRLVRAVAGALEKLLDRRATNWDEAFTRIVACEVLRRNPDWRSVPVLLKAFDDPYYRHFSSGGPRGHVGHLYRAIWWEADAALRTITQAEPVERPTRRRSPRKGEREKVLAAWQAWWNGRPGKGLLGPSQVLRPMLEQRNAAAALVTARYFERALAAINYPPEPGSPGKVNIKDKRLDRVWLVSREARQYLLTDSGSGWALELPPHQQSQPHMHLIDARTGKRITPVMHVRAVPAPLDEEADILDFAAKHPRNTMVREPDGTSRRPKYGDIRLERAEEALKKHAKPWTVKKVLSWYKEAKDGKTRAHLLHVLAASRHPKAAIELGMALNDSVLDVRVAATYGLLDYFLPTLASGGTESHMIAAAKWWQENHQRLLITTATQPSNSIHDHFGLRRIVSATVSQAPKGNFAAEDVRSVARKDPVMMAELATILQWLPAAGTVSKSFPPESPRWRIALTSATGKKHSLMFYGARLRAPATKGGSFYAAASAVAQENRLLDFIGKKFDPTRIDRAGTYVCGKWKYAYGHTAGRKRYYGWVYHFGRVLPDAIPDGGYYQTPWGRIHYVGYTKTDEGLTGWMPYVPDGRKEGKRLITPTARWSKLLKENLGQFCMVLRYHGKQDERNPYYWLTLTVPLLEREKLPAPYMRTIQITQIQAGKIIDHLAKVGLLAEPSDIFSSKPPVPLKSSAYSLRVKLVQEPKRYNRRTILGWDLRMLQHLDGLRKVLSGDSAKAMDKLLARLRPLRENLARTQKLIEALQAERFDNIRNFVFVRDGIIPIVRETGDREPKSFLAEQLQSADRRRRCGAAVCLELLGDRQGVPAIIKELRDTGTRATEMTRSDGKKWVAGQIRSDRYYAALLLGILADRRAVPALIEATRDETINYRAAISLGQIGDKWAIPALRAMRKDFPKQRFWAAYGLAMLGEAEGLQVLVNAVTDPQRHWTYRRHAVEALGVLRSREGVGALGKALKDEYGQVREAAAKALKRIRAGVATQPTTATAAVITGDPEAAVEKVLPRAWVHERTVWSGSSGCSIVLRDKARRGKMHAVLCILPSNAEEKPGTNEGQGKGFEVIMKAGNGQVHLWAAPGDWKTIKGDLARALVGEPLRVKRFAVELVDQRGLHHEVRIRANWLQLRRFSMTHEAFENACRRALMKLTGADVRKVRVDTGSHREMLLTDMADVTIAPGRQWATWSTPLKVAAARATMVLCAKADSKAEVFERHVTHMSTGSRDGRSGGGDVFFAQCRQTFSVVDVLLGQAKRGRRVLEYGFVEKSDCSPGPRAQQPIPHKAKVILLLDAKGLLLKALPDKPENRAAVKLRAVQLTVKLAPTHVNYHSALVLRAYDRQHGIVAHVFLPRKLQKALQVPVSGKQGEASVSYYRGKRIDNLLAPGGHPVLPTTQKALSGSVTVTPLPGDTERQKVEVTFKDLVFKGFRMKKIGPLKVLIGLPARY